MNLNLRKRTFKVQLDHGHDPLPGVRELPLFGEGSGEVTARSPRAARKRVEEIAAFASEELTRIVVSGGGLKAPRAYKRRDPFTRRWWHF